MHGKESGFSLLEIMIALAIFAVVALALAQLQISVVQRRIDAKRYAQAINYAEELLEKVRNTSFSSVNSSMTGITVSDTNFQRSLTTAAVDGGNTLKIVTIEVKWKDTQGNFISRNAFSISTKVSKE